MGVGVVVVARGMVAVVVMVMMPVLVRLVLQRRGSLAMVTRGVLAGGLLVALGRRRRPAQVVGVLGFHYGDGTMMLTASGARIDILPRRLSMSRLGWQGGVVTRCMRRVCVCACVRRWSRASWSGVSWRA